MRKLLSLAAMVLMLAAPVGAVEPDEILADPVLEARAREISKDVRCLVCRNENIDASDSSLARDLRLLVRERLVAGDTNDEVLDFIVQRYGEYALLRPRATGTNLVLYIAGPAMLIAGLTGAALYLRRRRPSMLVEAAPEALSDEEKARLAEILRS